MTTENPYKSNSLEWTTPIAPGHGNWPGAIPAVYRGSYEYGKDGHDFIPQIVKDSDIKKKETFLKSR